MRASRVMQVSVLVLGLIAGSSIAAVSVAWPDPGWTYEYTGAAAAPGTGGYTALDGTWNQDNGSDSWDGSDIGTGPPGGVSALTAGGVTHARVQDTGDPRDYGFPDPSSRKLYFAHDITSEGASAGILDTGVTISLRARVATGSSLDNAHPDGGGGIVPWPAAGDGYGVHDNGKGNFGIRAANDRIISFSLAVPSDHAEAGLTGGLLMNHLNGAVPTGDVDTGEAGTPNLLPLSDPTAWHEFWITIVAGGSGTHLVNIYADGSLTPTPFSLTAGVGDEGSGFASYLAMGAGSTGQSGAFDADFFAWKAGVIVPIPEPTTVSLLALGGLGLLRRRR